MHRYLSSLLLLAVTPSASAITIPYSDIAPRVRAEHPSLKAARFAIDEARGRQFGAGRLPNPTVGIEFQNESRVSPQTLGASLDQSFPITRRLGLEKRLTAQLVTAAELEVRDAERRFIAAAQSLAVRLLALEQQRALRQQQTAVAQKLADFVQGRAKAGELSALDAAQAQVDAQRLTLETRRLEAERVGLLGELKPMLGVRPADELSIFGGLPALALPTARPPWRQRADYQLALTKLNAAQTSVALAKASRWQDVEAGFFTAREAQDITPDHREHTGFIGLRLSVPLPVWNRNQGEIAEKTASAERARLETEALSAQIASEADTARREMEANATLAREAREKLLPLIIEQTEKLDKAYESGQADLITVLRARDQRLQMEAAVLDATRDFHLARIRYEAATGKHAPAEPTPPAQNTK